MHPCGHNFTLSRHPGLWWLGWRSGDNSHRSAWTRRNENDDAVQRATRNVVISNTNINNINICKHPPKHQLIEMWETCSRFNCVQHVLFMSRMKASWAKHCPVLTKDSCQPGWGATWQSKKTISAQRKIAETTQIISFHSVCFDVQDMSFECLVMSCIFVSMANSCRFVTRWLKIRMLRAPQCHQWLHPHRPSWHR